MLLGYNSVAPKKLRVHDLYFINADGEVSELISMFKKKESIQNVLSNNARFKESTNFNE